MIISKGAPSAGLANTASAVIVLAIVLGISALCYLMSYIIITYVTLVIALLWLTVMYALVYEYLRIKILSKIQ